MSSLSAASCLFALMLSTTAASAQTICIRVYNRAHVPAGTLHAAVLETTRLFKPAGVRITWQFVVESSEDLKLDMSASHRVDTRPYLALILTTRTSARLFPGALGFALPFAHTGAHASIFYDRVQSIAAAECLPPYIALGHAMAHELGHVLLRSNDHSPAGLMEPRWNKATWRLASQGLLGFLPSQLEPMGRAALALTAREAVVLATKNEGPDL
jgi:hypothetical protein